jgi:predicted ATP-grasp superfamily ATP-dependent carboligase
VLIHEHVTGGGLAGFDLPDSWAAEGSAMRRALATDFAALTGVLVTFTLDARLDDEPGPWSVVRVGKGEVQEILLRLAVAADHTILIAPETDGVLRELAATVELAGGRSLGASPRAIELTGDKLRLADHLGSYGIPSPESRAVRPLSGLPRDFPYPAVLKPICGAGSIDTMFVESADDPIASTYPHEVGLLQAFVVGEARSASFITIDGQDPVLLGTGIQRIRREKGRFSYTGGIITDETLPPGHPAREAVRSVTGLAGLVGVDYIEDPSTRRPTILEINPRPTTSCVGLVRALGPGRVASTWLDFAGGSVSSADLEPLIRRGTLVGFEADGTILE